MGVVYDCVLCGGQAGEYETVSGEHICTECRRKAMRIGISQLKFALHEKPEVTQ